MQFKNTRQTKNDCGACDFPARRLSFCREAINPKSIEITFNETFNDFFNNRAESVRAAGSWRIAKKVFDFPMKTGLNYPRNQGI
jgi:hypothetical protein